jgi:hypothetical protein
MYCDATDFFIYRNLQISKILKRGNKMIEINRDREKLSLDIDSEATSGYGDGDMKSKLEIDQNDHYQLSEQYQNNRIVLMVKNPESVHVYWEYTKERFKDDPFLILRFYDLTNENFIKYYDINITQDHYNWYINKLNPEHSYVVELGILDKNDEFQAMLRSNQVKTPANSISNALNEKWMLVNERMEKIYNLSRAKKSKGENHNSLSNIKEIREILYNVDVKTGYSSLTDLESSSITT